MDRDQRRQDAASKDRDVPGRGWTHRLAGPIRYRRFTSKDVCGRPSILFRFEEQQSGRGELPQEVVDILQSLKFLDRNPGLGHGVGRYPTGLTFMRTKDLGRVWRLPNDSTGRTAADILDARLAELAERLAGEPGRGR